jgi:uncharacterized protein
MKIAIISDIHDNIPNLDKALNYIKQTNIDKIICCGDFGSEETLAYLSKNYNGIVRAVLGNADEEHMEFCDVEDKFANIKLAEYESSFLIDGKQVLVVHAPSRYESYLANEDLGYIFYGHTHKPWQEVKSGKMILNPGNISNFRYSPTFAIWETESDKFELIQLNTIV